MNLKERKYYSWSEGKHKLYCLYKSSYSTEYHGNSQHNLCMYTLIIICDGSRHHLDSHRKIRMLPNGCGYDDWSVEITKEEWDKL